MVQLLIGGDSAGTHLCVALLSHLLHPHPEVAALQNGGQSLKGVILLSPWVTFDQSAESFRRNKQKDCLSVPGLKECSDAFMGDAPNDNYNTPLGAPSDWWQNTPADRFIVLAGKDEVFIDDIERFVEKLKVGPPVPMWYTHFGNQG